MIGRFLKRRIACSWKNPKHHCNRKRGLAKLFPSTWALCCCLLRLEDDPDGSAGDADRPLDWARWDAELREQYGWTFEQINQMTIAQMFIALTPKAKSGSVVSMMPSEAESFMLRKQRQRDTWIERQLRECH